MRKYVGSNAQIAVYWYGVPEGDRDAYASELKGHLQNAEIAVLVVRSSGFDNPNAVGSDLVDLIQLNRQKCELLTPTVQGQCALVLLGRTGLGIPQTSSPAPLPHWFPFYGEQTVPVLIDDLTWTAEIPMSSSESRISELPRVLFRVDGLLLSRLTDVHQVDHRKTGRLLEALRADDETLTLGGFLERALAFRDTVTDPSGFRPSRLADSLTSQLWRIFQISTDDGICKPAKALQCALDLQDDLPITYESIATTIRRPTGREPRAQRIARNMIVTVGTGCQLVTAAAHSDDYGLYPSSLLASTSVDLTRSLFGIEQSLAMLEAYSG